MKYHQSITHDDASLFRRRQRRRLLECQPNLRKQSKKHSGFPSLDLSGLEASHLLDTHLPFFFDERGYAPSDIQRAVMNVVNLKEGPIDEENLNSIDITSILNKARGEKDGQV